MHSLAPSPHPILFGSLVCRKVKWRQGKKQVEDQNLLHPTRLVDSLVRIPSEDDSSSFPLLLPVSFVSFLCGRVPDEGVRDIGGGASFGGVKSPKINRWQVTRLKAEASN
jgi:hypothetical protein